MICLLVAYEADFTATGSSTASATRRAISASTASCSSPSLDSEKLTIILKNSWIRASIFSFRRSRPCSASTIWDRFFISSIRVGCTCSMVYPPEMISVRYLSMYSSFIRFSSSSGNKLKSSHATCRVVSILRSTFPCEINRFSKWSANFR